jgi:RHS repeat-associated protein
LNSTVVRGNGEKKMKKRSRIGLGLTLAIALGVGPQLTLATAARGFLRNEASEAVKRVAVPVSNSIKPVRPTFSSKLLSKRPAQDASAHAIIPGQTATPLPDGRILKIGGLQDDGPASTALIDDLRFQLQRARAWHTATMLPDGNVLIVGGIGSNGAVEGAIEVFNLETKTSEILANSRVTPRVYHTATLLTEGLVLIAGGLSSEGLALRAAELWDFRTKTVASRAKLRTARYNHTASLLPNGKVLFTGGSGDGVPVLENRELYDPSNQRFTRADAGTPIDPQLNSVNPLLSGSLPEDEATSVALNTFVALRFSKPLRAETVNALTVMLTGFQGRVEARVIPAEGGMLAFVTPNVPLLPGVGYSVTLAGASDLGGSLVDQANITFTTMAGIPRGRVWVPGENNFNGDWTTGFPPSPWQELPALNGPPGVTALAGQVLRIDGWPLERVTMRIGDRSTATDSTGRFLLTEIEPGRKMLIVDCRPASTRKETYGLFMIAIDVSKSNETNVLPFTIWMPVLDTKHAIKIASPNKKEVVATTPLLPGLEVHIPPKSILRDFDGNALTSITITPVPLDRGPFPGPPGAKFPMFFTLQLGGTQVESADGTLSPGMKLVFPNYEKVPPGTRIVFWSYAADGVGWYTYGNGTVTDDGKQIVPDPGVTINLFTCASIGSPTEPDGPQDPSGDGDPVNLGTGLFVHHQTDLVLPDVIPISLTRIYRPNDPKWRPFGSGTRHPYEMFLVGDQTTYSYADLILPDGGKIRFNRISPGTGPSGAIMEATTTPTAFYKSTLTYYASSGGAAEARWDLRLREGTVYRFTVDTRDTAPLVAIIDRNGNQLSIVRTNDFTGTLQSRRITRIVSPNGRWVEFTYDANFHITQAKENIGRIVSYAYDGSGRLTQVTDAVGGVTQYSYDAANRMLTIRNAKGTVYLTNQYDTNGRVSTQTQPDGGVYQFAYTLNGSNKVTQTDVTTPRGSIRRVTFNNDGFATGETLALGTGVQQIYSYEVQSGTNFMLSVTDALGRKTSATYDSFGNTSTITRLADTANALTTSFTYESTFNQLTSISGPLNHTTNLAYDNSGNLISVTDPLGNQGTCAYNTAGLPFSYTNAEGKTTQFTYEGGDLVRHTNPLGQSVTRFVDAAGRVISISNALGHTVRYQWDALNRPLNATDPIQGVTSFTYDANNNLLSLTDPRGKVISYMYDSQDRAATRTDPLLHFESYQYDLDGNIHEVIDRKGQVTSYAYDPLNRLSLVTYTDSATVGYTYDAANRVTQIVDSVSGTISYGYDNLDRLTSETTSLGAIGYAYDSGGRLTSLTVPGQSVVNYAYDNANRLTQITQGSNTVSFAYDHAGRTTSQTLSNGVVTEYSYDDASHLTAITYKKSGVVLGNLTYGYDAAGRRIRLGGSYARTVLPTIVATTSYNDANRQTSFGGQSQSYDLNGNLTSDGVNSYTWNAREQLISISGSGLNAGFLYDAVGRRISKTINGVTTALLYNGDNIVQEQSGGAATANILGGGLDEFFGRTDASGARSPLADALGSPIALSDSSGVVQTEYTYEPFGATGITGTASTNPTQYTGRENDGTGLYYYRARYYSPSSQRFMSEDPIGLLGGLNAYAYALNNPISFRDPYGLISGDDLVGGITGFLSSFQLFDINGPTSLPLRDLLRANGITFSDCSYRYGFYAGIALQVAGMIAEPFLAPELEAEVAAAGAEGKAAAGAKGGAWTPGTGGTGGVPPTGGTAGSGASRPAYHVTSDGVAIPPHPKYDIPAHYVEHPNRTGLYGEYVNGKFRERLRVDPPTPRGRPGPDFSHYHLNGGKAHNAPRPGYPDPGFR